MSQPERPIDPSQFDEAVPAAEDFFRHVNGGWLDANPVPPEYGSWGAFNEVTERNQELLRDLLRTAADDPQPAGTPARMAGDYFAAAMDEAGIAAADAAPLAPYLELVDSIADAANVRGVLVALQRTGAGPFHSLGISPDFEDADVYLVYLGQGGLGLPERDYYTRDDERSVTLREAYMGHVARQLVNLGYETDAAADAAGRILAFETRLAQPSYTAQQMRDVQLTLNRHTVDSLDELMPAFGMSAYVRELGVTSPTVSVDNAGFFGELDAALADTPVETLRDYLRWNVVRAFASSLSPRFEDEAFDFYGRTLGGQQQMRPRWKRMIDAATADIGEQVAQLYVDAAFSEQAKERCEQMVAHLLTSMGEAIRGAEWMGEATKEQALAKLAGFTYKIGFPDTWRDYSALEIGRDSFARNRIRASEFEYDREMGRLGEPVDKTEWAMAPHSVNAYYHPLLNEIVFPAGILQPPFFHSAADDAVNYGAIGAVIAHEITHGFDDQGSRFDAAGALREWWTEDDRAEFDRRSAKLVEQFDEFEVEPGLRVNGRLTLGENIADLGGLTISLRGLTQAGGLEIGDIDGLSALQRFFISWATVWHINYTDEYRRLLVNVDPHSPGRFRVNGPLANMPAFAEAFAVPDGSPMREPERRRAHIW